MDPNRQPAVQVVINGHSQPQTHGPNGPSHCPARPLNVGEALQYSPMSSSPVFGLGLTPNSFFPLYEPQLRPVTFRLHPSP